MDKLSFTKTMHQIYDHQTTFCICHFLSHLLTTFPWPDKFSQSVKMMSWLIGYCNKFIHMSTLVFSILPLNVPLCPETISVIWNTAWWQFAEVWISVLGKPMIIIITNHKQSLSTLNHTSYTFLQLHQAKSLEQSCSLN